jgi:hypothetical protein
LRDGAKRIVFWSAAGAIVVVAAEIASFAVTRLRPDLFDERATVLSRLDAAGFEQFKRAVAHPVLGWDNPAATVHAARDCTGKAVSYAYGPDRNRIHGNSTTRDAVVLIAGDSYTHGAEAYDDDTYPAALERLLDAPVANLGVNGYDPVQALLKLEQLVDAFPQAQVAVLAIMYENTFRMFNSFRPVYLKQTGVPFGFKPYLKDEVVQGLPGGDPFRDFATARRAAEAAFDTDFWRKARPGFPYVLTIAEALTLPSFWMRAASKVSLMAGRSDIEPIYRFPYVRQSLRALYERFADWSERRGMKPVIAFIPYDARDLTSGLLGIEAANAGQRKRITFINVDRGIEGPRYNLGPGCHPSAAGYRVIAENLAAGVRPLLATRTSTAGR